MDPNDASFLFYFMLFEKNNIKKEHKKQIEQLEEYYYLHIRFG